MPGEFHDIIAAPANAKIQPSVSHVYRMLRMNAGSLYQKLPAMHHAPMKPLVHHMARHMLSTRRVEHPGTDPPPPAITQTHIRAMKDSLPCYKFIFLDKNAWCYALCCCAFWLYTVYQAYNRNEYVSVRKYSNDTECQSVMFLYYYFLSIVIPTFSSCHPTRTARRNITTAMPWIKGYRLPHPEPITERVDSDEKAKMVRERLLTLAEDTVQEISRKAEVQGRGSPYTLHTPNVTRWHTTPNTRCAGKNKSIPVAPGDDMATREMFSHAKHPLGRPLKQVSRISSVLERHYTCAFVTLNVLSQQHLIQGFFEPAKAYFSEHNEAVGGGELDVVRMFPSLSREKIVKARTTLLKRWKPQLDLQRLQKNVHVSVGKTSDTKMDCVGIKGQNLWNVYTVDAFLEMAFANLFVNDIFIMGDTLMRQAEGTAIGGPTSAQDADICLLADESEVPWGTTVPLSLKLARFRGNIMFLCPLKYCQFWAHHLKAFLTDLYGVELDFEQLGRGLTFLETEVWCEHNQVEWGLKNKGLSGRLTKNPQMCRYPSKSDPMAAQLVRALAIANGKKALTVATSATRIRSNFAHVVWEMEMTQYPKVWRLSHLRKLYMTATGVKPWQDIVRDKPWLAPVPAKMCLLDPGANQPQVQLTHVQPSDDLTQVWNDSPTVTLKVAVTAPVPHTPPKMHRPRTADPQDRTRTAPEDQAQPIAHRTRSHTAPSRKLSRTHGKKPKHPRSKRVMVPATSLSTFSNKTRRPVSIQVGNSEIHRLGAHMAHYLHDMWWAEGCDEHPV